MSICCRMLCICILLNMLQSIQAVDYSIDFTNPITLISSVKFVKTTPTGRIIVHLDSGLWYVYNSTFDLQTTFTMLNQTWSMLQINSDVYGGIVNLNRDTVCLVNLTSYAILFTYSMPGVIQIKVTYISPKVGIAAVNSTNMFSLQGGNVTFMYNFSSNNLVGFGFDTSINLGGATFAGGQVFKLKKISLPSISAYYTITNIYNHSVAASKVNVINNSILFTQDSNNVIMCYNLSGNYPLNVSPVLYQSLNKIIQISYDLMFIYQNKLTYVYYNTISLMFQPITSASYSQNLMTINFIQVSSSYIAYTADSNVLYSVNLCTGNAIYNGVSCQVYACTDVDCLNCPIQNSICGKCVTGYTLIDNFTCQISPIIVSNNTNSSYSVTNNSYTICRIYQVKNQNNQCIVPESNRVWESILNISKMINSIPAIRVLVLFCSPIFGFLDDYWYYIYHLKPNGDSFTYLILWQLYIINNQRYIPQFLPLDSVDRVMTLTTDLCLSGNYSVYTPQIIHQIDQTSIYFFQTMAPTVIFNWGICFLILLICRIINKFLSNFSQHNQKQGLAFKIYRYFKKYFQQKALLGILIIAMFQSNLIMICFKGTLQILEGFSFNSTNKFNLVITHMIYFLSLIFAVSFYLFLTTTDPRKYQSYLSDKKQLVKSFILQFYLIGVKNLMYGMIHSLLLSNSHIFYLLIFTKVTLLSAFWKFRKVYKNKISASLTFSYFAFGIILDIYLLWHQNTQNQSLFSERYLFQQICIYSLIFIIILKTCFDGLVELIQLAFDGQQHISKKKHISQANFILSKSINKVGPQKVSMQSMGDLSTAEVLLNLKIKQINDGIKNDSAISINSNPFKLKRSSIQSNLQLNEDSMRQCFQIKPRILIQNKKPYQVSAFYEQGQTNQKSKVNLQDILRKEKIIIKKPIKQKNQSRSRLKVVQNQKAK